MALDSLKIVGKTPAAAQKKPGEPVALPQEKADVQVRNVDVAQFRILPLAGAPLVSASVDKTLGSMDPIAAALSKLETTGGIGSLFAKGARLFTRVTGPTAYMASAVLNVHHMIKAWSDPTIKPSSKVVLTLGTLGTVAGALLATVSTLPLKLAAKLHISLPKQVMANKFSGIAGGIASTGFSVINLVETLRNKDAKPTERFFSKLGFVLGVGGFLFGTAAMMMTMPAVFPGLAALATRAPLLLDVFTKIGTWTGILGIATWAGQSLLGKNKWLNDHLQGTFLG